MSAFCLFRVTVLLCWTLFPIGCRLSAEVFREDIELDELDLDIDDDDSFGIVKVSPVERERNGVRLGFGEESVLFTIQVADEEFDEDFDAVSGGIGVEGRPPLDDLSEDVALILPFKFGLLVTDGDAEITDEEGNLVETDVTYGELELEVGLGADIQGLQPSIGLYLSTIYGSVDAEVPATGEDPSFDLYGSNAGLFADLRYQTLDFPLFANARVLFGDVEGFRIGIGVAF